MKQIYLNNYSCNLMVWETNPNKRNKNNVINVMVKNDKRINLNDVIIGSYSPDNCSSYIVIEIKEERPAGMNGYIYYSLTTKWINKKPTFKDYELHTDKRFNKLYNLN